MGLQAGHHWGGKSDRSCSDLSKVGEGPSGLDLRDQSSSGKTLTPQASIPRKLEAPFPHRENPARIPASLSGMWAQLAYLRLLQLWGMGAESG